MKKLIVLFIILLFPSFSYGAAFTTKANGNWSADGQTTWNEAGVPGDGDTVTITKAIVADTSVTIGNSPAAGTAVVSISNTAGSSLTIAAGTTFRIKGDLSTNANDFTVENGATVIWDSSGASSPSTTSYRLYYAANSVSADVYINGTSGSRCTLTAETANSALGWHINVAGGVNGDFVATYADFTNMNHSAVNRSINHSPGDAKTFRLDHCTITNHTKNIYVGGSSLNTSNIDYRYTYIDASAGDEATATLYILSPVATTGQRNLVNCYIGGALYNASPGSLEGWTLDGSVFTRIVFVDITPIPGAMASGKNCTFSANVSASAPYSIKNSSANFEDFFFLHNTYANNASHFTAAFLYTNDLTLNKGVIESSNNSPSDNCLHAPYASTSDPIDRTYVTQQNNNIFAYNAGGSTSGRPFQFKAARMRQFTFDNNTVPLMYSQSPAAGAVSHGTNSTNHADLVHSMVNNLSYKPDAYTSVTDRTWLVKDAQNTVLTGTAQAGSTTSSLVAASTIFNLGSMAIVGNTVQITSGPDAGLKRTIDAVVSGTNVTVGTAFPNTMAGQTYAIYAVDTITLADYNSFYGARAEGVLYDSDNVSSRTGVTGYGDFHATDTPLIGAHDRLLPAIPEFVDDQRTIARFSIDYLGNSVATGWETATAYAVGDIRSKATSGVYGGRAVNYRCIKAHTSGTVDDTPGSYTGSATVNWRVYWEYEGMFEIRRTQLEMSGYNPKATQANYLRWMQDGYTPIEMSLSTSGYNGSYVSARIPIPGEKAKLVGY